MDMTAAQAQAWGAEPDGVLGARARAREVGVGAVPPAVGSLLRTLVQLLGARTVAETGTGAGVSTLWLAAGLPAAGMLTSIDTEPEHQRLARLGLKEAGVATGQVRLIAGRALEVMPRLVENGYDLVHLDAAPDSYLRQLEQARRLVRPGGLVVVSGALRCPDLTPEALRGPGEPNPASVPSRKRGAAAPEGSGGGAAPSAATLLPLGDGVLLVVG